MTWQVNRCSVRRVDAGLHLSGDVDQENWREIAGLLAAGARDGAHHVDLTGMTYFGADGVRALLIGRDALPGGADLHVRCTPMIFRVLRLCGLADAEGLVLTQDSP